MSGSVGRTVCTFGPSFTLYCKVSREELVTLYPRLKILRGEKVQSPLIKLHIRRVEKSLSGCPNTRITGVVIGRLLCGNLPESEGRGTLMKGFI